MIPIEIDVVSILDDLNRLGFCDEKIQTKCGFSAGYVAKLRAGPRPMRPYQYMARIYNFWYDQKSPATRHELFKTST